MRRGTKITLGVGMALVTLGVVVGLILFPRVLVKKIKGQIRLEEGGDLYNRWKDIPIPIFMKVFVFNVTNPEELAIGKKPILQETGPYIYQQKRQKVVESIHPENDTIQYRQKITYYFRPDLSEGRTEDDVINFINVPLVSVVSQAMQQTMFARSFIKSIVDDHDEPLFLHRTVGEILFKGYYEPMIAELSGVKNEELMPDNTFGIYYGKNGTTRLSDLMEIYTGVIDNEKFGQTISWKGETVLNFWGTESCNMINGSDGSIFPPFVTRDRVVQIFSPDMCRSIYMTYVKDVELLGIPAYRFSTPKEVLEDPRIFEENMCYCTQPGDDGEGCTKGGVFALGACRKGAPVVASWPHFYDGDEEYVKQSIGLKPVKELHETFLSLEPNTGALLQASKRFQINVQLKPTKYFKQMKKVPEMLLPILWADESVMLNDENAQMIKRKLLTPLKVSTISTFSVLGLGAALIVIAIGLICFSNKKSEKA